MDLSTQFLGLKLKNPIVPSAGPLTGSIETLCQLEEAGASAVVLPSLFEEEILQDEFAHHMHIDLIEESYAEATSYFPEPPDLHIGPDRYLDLIRRAKNRLDIPVIASLNGVSQGGWTRYAKRCAEAGADALELNMYYIPTDPEQSGLQLEEHYVKVVRSVVDQTQIPVAVKLSPYFTNLTHFVGQLKRAGAGAVVLFNRFYQPDIDLDNLEVLPNIVLSQAFDMRLPLRWTAILRGRVDLNIAVTSGVTTAQDVLKCTMAGADVTQMLASLIRFGPFHIQQVLKDVRQWMEEHDYESLEQMRGSMSHRSVSNPSSFERANYYKALHSYIHPETH